MGLRERFVVRVGVDKLGRARIEVVQLGKSDLERSVVDEDDVDGRVGDVVVNLPAEASSET